ncbi:MAG: DNA cytosine methyltransferase [Gemmatimonadales bacterium]|nr:DNA cytosine methyltransferase [Gemmatimonadales bacterium]
MSLGVAEACRALGRGFSPVAAFDIDPAALKTYSLNFGLHEPMPADLGTLLAPRLGTRMTPAERALKRRVGRVDIVVAGPPCQGHSNLNNATRRNDPRNGLYFRVARFAELFAPSFIFVENVAMVLHDHGNVVEQTRRGLESLGYIVSHGIVDLSRLGLAQRRRRHVMLATMAGSGSALPRIEEIVELHARPPRSLRWAIGDLKGFHSKSPIDRPTGLKPETQRRIDFLFDHDLYDLPDSERPACHRDKVHSYGSVYGRLRWNQPAPTITGGFDTMGRGRFVHPGLRRTLTPREGARIQGLPDWFDFSPVMLKRSNLVRTIGNAVPPRLTYVLALECLR